MIILKLNLKKLVPQLQLQIYFQNLKFQQKKEDKLTNAKKGKVILVKSTAKLNLYIIFNKAWSN